MNRNFFKNKIVLVTGHTGFKGSWLCVFLKELGANVIGYSIDISTPKDNYVLCELDKKIEDIRGDILDLEYLKSIFTKYNPDIVFHLAAQPLVIESYKDPIETYTTNVIGTLNVLEAMKNINKKCVGIMVTTDKCYENKEQLWGYRENDALGGYDPYSSSKACCEILINSFRNSFFNLKDYKIHKKSISSVRAGNVIGGGDWAENRLIPDCIRAIEKNEKIIIRNPDSVRPWQHVLEALYGYLILAKNMYTNPIEYSDAYNFGPDTSKLKTVEEIVNILYQSIDQKTNIEILKETSLHESNLLLLDNSKSRIKLSWRPLLDLDTTVKWTAYWYKNYNKENVYEICKSQVYEYLKLVGDKK